MKTQVRKPGPSGMGYTMVDKLTGWIGKLLFMNAYK